MSNENNGRKAADAGTQVPLDPVVLRRLAWLDLSTAQHRFSTAGGTDAALGKTWHLSLEYRRFLLLRLAYPDQDIPAPPLIDGYWRHHASDPERFAAACRLLTHDTAATPATLRPPPTPTRVLPGDAVRELYEQLFPVGNAALWGWLQIDPGYRHGAPWLGPIHTRLPTAIDEPTRTQLRAEALRQRAHAIVGSGTTTPPKPPRRGHVSGSHSGHGRVAAPGAVLHDLHWTGTIPRLIEEVTGAVLAPSAANYLYYGSGAFTGLHTDLYGDDLVLLTLLDGSVESLHCHLHLGDTPLAEIGALAEATGGFPDGGTPFDIGPEPLLLSGQRIPHHRPPRERATETIVMAQFFSPLLPSPQRAPHPATTGAECPVPR